MTLCWREIWSFFCWQISWPTGRRLLKMWLLARADTLVTTSSSSENHHNFDNHHAGNSFFFFYVGGIKTWWGACTPKPRLCFVFFPVGERWESFLEQSLICGEIGNSAHPLYKETSKETFYVKIPLVKKLWSHKILPNNGFPYKRALQSIVLL